MIVTRISDGFGNQLFMYACGYALSRKLNTGLALDTTMLATNPSRSLEINKLNIQYDKLITINDYRTKFAKVVSRFLIHKYIRMKYRFYVETTPYVYESGIQQISDNTYIQGYWQSEKYFSEYRNDLLRLFLPKYEQSRPCKECMDEVGKCNSVAIHVRRGDYNKIGVCIGKEYYLNAIEKMKNCIDDPVFYVFSDDLGEAKKLFQNLNGTFVYVQYLSDNLTLDDFFIMKACRHQIIANSSYSWWAAWLNENDEKIVICPEYKQWTGDFYPENWILIKCIGRES